MSVHQKKEANLDKQRGLFYVIGFIFGLTLLLTAFEWRTFTEIVQREIKKQTVVAEVEEIAPVMLTTPPPPQQAPPPPPPPPSVPEVLQLVDDDVEIDETELDFSADDDSDNRSDGVIGGVEGGTGPVLDEVVDFMVVEDLPVFPGCEGVKGNDNLLECFDRQLGNFLAKNVSYPSRAREMGKEGVVHVKFTIGKDGIVRDVQLALPDRKIGYGLEEESINVVKKLPKMQPAKQRNVPTSVSYIVPIQFKLQ
ncbi:MAG: energy transducer TonB [Flavobacteriales bacterium]